MNEWVDRVSQSVTKESLYQISNLHLLRNLNQKSKSYNTKKQFLLIQTQKICLSFQAIFKVLKSSNNLTLNQIQQKNINSLLSLFSECKYIYLQVLLHLNAKINNTINHFNYNIAVLFRALQNILVQSEKLKSNKIVEYHSELGNIIPLPKPKRIVKINLSSSVTDPQSLISSIATNRVVNNSLDRSYSEKIFGKKLTKESGKVQMGEDIDSDKDSENEKQDTIKELANSVIFQREGSIFSLRRAPKQRLLCSGSQYFSGTLRANQLEILTYLPLAPVIRQTDKFSVELHSAQYISPVLNVADDVYQNEFLAAEHFNFLGFNDKTCQSIISILKNPVPIHPEISWALDLGTSYKSVLTHKNGVITFSLQIHINDPSEIETELEDYLNSSAKHGIQYHYVPGTRIVTDIISIEEKHPQKVTKLKVAVLYAKPYQTDLMEIFSNTPEEDKSHFWPWLDSMAELISLKDWNGYKGDFGDVGQDSYYTVWKDIEIMFHIAPLMTPEQHRRLIGNDICVILFSENPDGMNNDSVNVNVLDSLGTVPQVFCVVQPQSQGYRLGFFNRTNLKPFNPVPPPVDYILSAGDLKEFLFTKLHNGFRMAMSCPPMNRLFATPRAATIQDIADKYITDPRLKKKNKRRSKKLGKGPKSHILLVSVIKGRDLPVISNSESYCSITFCNQTEKLALPKNPNPEFLSSDFRFNIFKDQDCGLEITCTDVEANWSVTIKDVIKTDKSEKKWYPLISKSTEKITGELMISTYVK